MKSKLNFFFLCWRKKRLFLMEWRGCRSNKRNKFLLIYALVGYRFWPQPLQQNNSFLPPLAFFIFFKFNSIKWKKNGCSNQLIHESIEEPAIGPSNNEIHLCGEKMDWMVCCGRNSTQINKFIWFRWIGYKFCPRPSSIQSHLSPPLLFN